MARLRGAVAAVGGVAVAGLLAACGSGSTTTSTTSTPGTPTIATAAPPSVSSNIALTPNAPAPQPCAASDLTVTLGSQNEGMGHLIQTIEFRNHGAGACTLAGYPGVALAGGSPPAQIGLAAVKTQRDPAAAGGPAAVALAPDAVAHALVAVTRAENFDPTACAPTPADTMLVYSPSDGAPARLPFDVLACAKPIPLLQVTVVSAGG